MANTLAPKGVFTPLFPSRSRLSWIKRRARKIAASYQEVNRREAVATAASDWHMFNPTATH